MIEPARRDFGRHLFAARRRHVPLLPVGAFFALGTLAENVISAGVECAWVLVQHAQQVFHPYLAPKSFSQHRGCEFVSLLYGRSERRVERLATAGDPRRWSVRTRQCPGSLTGRAVRHIVTTCRHIDREAPDSGCNTPHSHRARCPADQGHAFDGDSLLAHHPHGAAEQSEQAFDSGSGKVLPGEVRERHALKLSPGGREIGSGYRRSTVQDSWTRLVRAVRHFVLEGLVAGAAPALGPEAHRCAQDHIRAERRLRREATSGVVTFEQYLAAKGTS